MQRKKKFSQGNKTALNVNEGKRNGEQCKERAKRTSFLPQCHQLWQALSFRPCSHSMAHRHKLPEDQDRFLAWQSSEAANVLSWVFFQVRKLYLPWWCFCHRLLIHPSRTFQDFLNGHITDSSL